jgi:hypothetical protein
MLTKTLRPACIVFAVMAALALTLVTASPSAAQTRHTDETCPITTVSSGLKATGTFTEADWMGDFFYIVIHPATGEDLLLMADEEEADKLRPLLRSKVEATYNIQQIRDYEQTDCMQMPTFVSMTKIP